MALVEDGVQAGGVLGYHQVGRGPLGHGVGAGAGGLQLGELLGLVVFEGGQLVLHPGLEGGEGGLGGRVVGQDEDGALLGGGAGGEVGRAVQQVGLLQAVEGGGYVGVQGLQGFGEGDGVLDGLDQLVGGASVGAGGGGGGLRAGTAGGQKE